MAVALAAPHSRAVEAGAAAARAGGNALDAALAAAAMLTVVYPHQCAIGGDLIALVRDPEGRTRAVLGAGTAPAAIAEASADWTAVPRFGAHSVTVPGMLAGWQAIAGLGARLPLASALESAASVAAEGTAVSAGLERAIISRTEAILADPGMRGVFAPEGEPLVEGELLVQPALAATLRRLAADPGDFYSGETARSLVSTLRAAGGVHTEADFAAFEVEIADPVVVEVGEATWTATPPPSAGAVLLGVVAAGDASTPEGLLDAAVRAAAARATHLGDPRAVDTSADDLAALLAPAAEIAVPVGDPRPTGDTAAVVAVDDEGWAVSIVQSVFFTFGAGLLDPASGVLLHNRGSAFTLDPALPSRIGPGLRPPHTLTPAIVDEGDTTVVAGCQGGRAQPWILAQLLGDAVAAESLEPILARPRWIIGAQDLGQPELSLVAEPGASAAVVAHAHALGLPTVSWPGPADEAGHVQIVRRRAEELDAASDPRADGAGALIR